MPKRSCGFTLKNGVLRISFDFKYAKCNAPTQQNIILFFTCNCRVKNVRVSGTEIVGHPTRNVDYGGNVV